MKQYPPIKASNDIRNAREGKKIKPKKKWYMQ